MILKVQIVSGSGKIRDGGPNDDLKDKSRDDLTENLDRCSASLGDIWRTCTRSSESG